jgi:ribose transport system substrate-binding protein
LSRSLEHSGNSRLHKILALVRKYGRIGVKDLSRTFGVSEVTVRSDLAELAKQGLITRTFGGAIDVPAATWRQELAPGEARDPSDSLRALGEAAARLLVEGDVAYLDSSEETRAMLPFLAGRSRLTLICSNLQAAWELARQPELEVVLVAGPVAGSTLTIEAEFESNPLLARTNISKIFFGCWGLSEAEGFTDINPAEARLKREIIVRAKEVVALVKADRWNRVSASTFARIGDIDLLITEKEAAPEMLDFCRSGEARVLQTGEQAEARERASPYPYFEGLREYARDHLEYPERPGRGHSLAFCNGCRSQSFGRLLEKSILEQAELAGFERNDVLVLDNDFDAEKASVNAEQVLQRRPDTFIQFQVDVRINNAIAHRFEKAGIPVIAVEIPIPSVPFVGLNNWKVAMMAGEYASAHIRKRWGGAEGIDLVLLLQMSVCGELAMLRTEGFADALVDSFGEDLQTRILRADCGMGKIEGAEREISRILAAHPQAHRMVITALDEELMEGAIRSLRRLGRWDRDELILVNYGCTTVGREQLRQGLIDATVASFPERYGEYLLPAACALLARQPVPGYTYVQNALITKDNIDQFYP